MKKLITTLSFAAAIILSSTMAQAENYRVCRGDTLSGIGERCGVCFREIMRANNLTSTTIQTGQVLHIPKGRTVAPAPAYVAPKPVPTPSYSYPKPAPKPVYGSKKPSKNIRIHTVRRGESLGTICSRYDVSPRDVLKANNLRSTTIYVGQDLRIPTNSRFNVAGY